MRRLKNQGRSERFLAAAALLITACLILYEGFSGRWIDPAESPLFSFPQAVQTDALPQDSSVSLINLNTADQMQLMSLPGIGEVKAVAILEYRAENGPFRSIEELEKVKGIGGKTMEALRGKITV